MDKHFDSRHIILLSGLRRVGKTTLLKLFIQNLIQNKKLDPKKILYISMDDYLLIKESILDIIETYRSIHKISFKEKVYLFLDEIVYKQDFPQQLKNLYDSHNVKI